MKITAIDNGYSLQNEAGETLSLSDQELAELVRDGHRLIDPQSRFQPLATMTAKDIVVSIDAHHSQAILRFVGDNDAETAFAIPGNHVKRLAEALAKKADQIDEAQSRKTEH